MHACGASCIERNASRAAIALLRNGSGYFLQSTSSTSFFILLYALILNIHPQNCSVSCSRADYWKSQGRKFCDFCKCWIADNKPSIDFHEGGKKHKENVSKRLKEIHKNSAKQAKQNKKIENDIKKMENVRIFLFALFHSIFL